MLAVIVILGLLAVIIVPPVAKTLKNQKESLYKTQIKLIEDAAESWAAENFFSLPTNDNEVKIIYLKDLKGFIDTNITNPTSSNLTFGECLEIKITKVDGTENYTYKVDESTINNNIGC